MIVKRINQVISNAVMEEDGVIINQVLGLRFISSLTDKHLARELSYNIYEAINDISNNRYAYRLSKIPNVQGREYQIVRHLSRKFNVTVKDLLNNPDTKLTISLLKEEFPELEHVKIGKLIRLTTIGLVES